MDPRPSKPNPSDPLTPPMAEAVPEAGETASGSHTAASDNSSSVIPVPPREPQANDMIGPYRIRGQLGKGGMATVYLAEEIQLKRLVALKVLLPAMAAIDPLAKARFLREAQAQAAVEHDHIIPIYAVGEAGGVSFIAMPVLRGLTLAAALKLNAQPEIAEVVRITREMASGLVAAHEKKLVHRDIKPGNVWLEGDRRRVKVLDFGLAREVITKDKELTIDGKVVGTPAYMSPEQAKGKPVDHRTDLFSLGVVLYQMTTGQKPFNGDTSYEIMAAILTDQPFPVTELAPHLPPKLAALINRLLAKDPDARPQSAARVVAELEAIEKALLVPPVVVQALPAALHAPAAPNPFADMEVTEKEKTTPVAKSSARNPKPKPTEEPRRRKTKPDRDDEEEEDDDKPARARSLKWVWIAAGVVGFLVVGGLVWLAADQLSPKKQDTAEKKDQPKTNPQPQPKPKDKEPQPTLVGENDRTAAEIFIKKAKLKLLLENGQEPEYAANSELPKTGRLVVTEIDFGDEQFEPTYTLNTFLPNIANLKSLREVRMLRWQLRLNAAQVGLIASMPLANTLERLDARIELTPESLDSLKKCTKLTDVTLSVPDATDALFKRLASEMPKLKLVTLFSAPDRDDLTDEGWKALAKLKELVWITLVRCPAGANAFRVLTTKGATHRPGSSIIDFQVCDTIDDAALLELSKRGTDVKTLCLRSVNVTDKGLEHLVNLTSLKKLTLNQTNVTEKGVKALREARNGALEILWDGKPFTPEP